MQRPAHLSTWLVPSLLALTTACVSAELEVPTNHPGHPAARAGKTPKTTTLGSVQAPPKPATIQHAPHSEHSEHKGHGEQATHVCSMHPEVVSKGPGQCPICGMKLEPRKAGQ
jgi:hypothetical protein